MSYYLHSAIENLYLRNAPTYANYDIPKKIFSDIFFFFLEIYCRNTILMRYDTMRITRSIKEENYDMIYERGLGVSLYYKLLYLTTMFKNFKKNNNNPEKQLLLGLFEEKKKPIQNTPRTILSSSLLNTSMGYIHKEDFVDPILLFLLTLIYNWNYNTSFKVWNYVILPAWLFFNLQKKNSKCFKTKKQNKKTKKTQIFGIFLCSIILYR